jgi:hypothetical protein
VIEAKPCKAISAAIFCGQVKFLVARHRYLQGLTLNIAAERFWASLPVKGPLSAAVHPVDDPSPSQRLKAL